MGVGGNTMKGYKGRYVITQKQVETIKKHALNNEIIKILRVIREVEHMQYLGDSTKSVKDDLKSLRMTI